MDEETRRKLREEMRAYAVAHAKGSGQFVEESDSHVTRRLLRETKWKEGTYILLILLLVPGLRARLLF